MHACTHTLRGAPAQYKRTGRFESHGELGFPLSLAEPGRVRVPVEH